MMQRSLIVLATVFAFMGAPAFASEVYSTKTSTLAELIENPDTKAILDRHLPTLSDNPQIAMASGMTLRAVAPMAGGGISDEAMDAIDADLKELAE